MLKIKKHLFTDGYDYELEDGTMLHQSEWNGEVYIANGKEYRPVTKHDDEHDQFDSIGFQVE